MNPKVHLVSFADGAFALRKLDFIKEAELMDVFDSVTVYDFDMLAPAYKVEHGKFINENRRGFGYWIWKPQVCLQKLEEVSDGDFIVYMDVGFELNYKAQKRFKEYLILTQVSEFKMLSFSNTHTEYRWNKADLAIKLRLSKESPEWLTTQLGAGLFVFQKNKSNIELLKQWKDIAVADNYHYSDDTPSNEKNHDEFIEHRHDASIFSLLRKARGTAVTHYEVQSYNHFEQIKYRLPFWASRKGRAK